jgi:hypothetical protein
MAEAGMVKPPSRAVFLIKSNKVTASVQKCCYKKESHLFLGDFPGLKWFYG